MEIKEYSLGMTDLIYLITEEGRTSFVLLPHDQRNKMVNNWETEPDKILAGNEYNKEWCPGSLVQLHLRHHRRSLGSGATMKYSESTDLLRFERQWEEQVEDGTRIYTLLKAPENYKILHTLTWIKGETALFCNTEFINESDRDFEIEMLTSFCMENLSPCQKDNDQTEKINCYRFRGGWALEGMQLCQPVEELGLQKAWCSPFPKSEKFGSIGSWPSSHYFPMAALEDKGHHILWAAALEHNASWQMEVSRDGDQLSFSGGIADLEYGAWMKRVRPGGHFCAPRAYVTAVTGDIYDACQSITKLQNMAADRFGEKGLTVIYNEYGSSWGNPDQAKVLEYARILKDKGIRYFVIDAGWSRDSQEQLGNGEWLVDTQRFPDMKEMNARLRDMGMIPGIWFEFEVTTTGSPVYDKKYDSMHLKREGIIIHTGPHRTYWDFTKPEVVVYLTRHVIDMLREYGFGYLKVDYNGNLGLGCDGAESLGEGLRQQMEGVRNFFQKIKEEIPDIIIENCASGGNRSEPSMFAVTAMTSFSDAHEAKEIPYVAANLQNLVLPRQNQIWAILRGTDTKEMIEYKVAAGFMGRICLSGDIEQLTGGQWSVITEGLEFYRKLEHILFSGVSRIYGKRSLCIRHPKGTQAVVRSNDQELLIVCHGFQDTEDEIVIPVEKGYLASASYGCPIFQIEENQITVLKMKEWSAGAILLKKD